MPTAHRVTVLLLFALMTTAADAQADWVRQHYDKTEAMVPMRDGVRLFTSIYVPKAPGPHPILLQRTPYGVGPYGADAYRSSLGPSDRLMRDGYIIVYQDVRGKLMSEGEFVAVRPHNPDKGARDIDESTDASLDPIRVSRTAIERGEALGL